MRFLKIVVCILFFHVCSSSIHTWRTELARAKTKPKLRMLRKKIQKKMYILPETDAQEAQIFIDVIDRKLMHKPYAEDLMHYTR